MGGFYEFILCKPGVFPLALDGNKRDVKLQHSLRAIC